MTPPSTRDEAESLYYAALEHIAAGDAGLAVAGLRQALVLDPTLLDAMHALVRALKDQRDYEAALAVALELLALDAEDVLAHTSLSILYQHLGMVPEAEAAALKAKLLGWKQQLAQAKHP